MLGTALVEMDEFEEAMVHLRHAVVRLASSENLVRHVDGVLARGGWHVGQAIQLCDQRLDEDPDDPWNHYELGMMFYVDEQYTDAGASLEEALRRQPESAMFHFFRTYFLLLDGDHEEGMKAAENLPRLLGPFAGLICRGMTQSLIRENRLESAIAMGRLAVRSSPDDGGAHGALARALMTQGDLAAAAQAFQDTLQHDSSFYNVRGFGGALPGSSYQSHYLLGECLTALGRHEEARVNFEECERMHPGGIAEPRERTRRLLSEREYQYAWLATEDSRTDTSLNSDPEIRIFRTLLQMLGPDVRAGRSWTLRGDAREVLRRTPQAPRAWTTQALVHFRSQELDACLAALDQAASLGGGPSPPDCLIRALVHGQRGDHASAYEWYLRGANQHDPKHPTPFEAVTELIQKEAAEMLRR
jgi:tetratricopeptide (TPR) repeat protein